MRREIHLTFPSAPNHVRTRRKASASKRKSTFFFRGKTQLTDFSQISQNRPRTLPVHDVIHIPWSHPLSGIFILTSVNDTSSPHARQHLCSSLHLTNPYAKRKVLSLTKPKGRIYKTKSLGHYITSVLGTTAMTDKFNSTMPFWTASMLLRGETNNVPNCLPSVQSSADHWGLPKLTDARKSKWRIISIHFLS